MLINKRFILFFRAKAAILVKITDSVGAMGLVKSERSLAQLFLFPAEVVEEEEEDLETS